MNAVLAEDRPMTEDTPTKRGYRRPDSNRRPDYRSEQPPRHQRNNGIPLFHAIPGMLDLAARLIEARVCAIYRAHRPSGGYVFIDREWRVYVLPEHHAAVEPWIRERTESFVGYYTPANRGSLRDPRGPVLTIEGLQGDIEEHLAEFPPPRT